MPADARTLLKAAANERVKAGGPGITDPFASYSSTGTLRCSACSYLTIKHESLWGSHVLSKSHRGNVARTREEELRQAEIQRTKDGKRKAADDAPFNSRGEKDTSLPSNGVDELDAGHESKKARKDESSAAAPVDAEWEMFKSQMDSSGAEAGADEPTEDYTAAGAALEAEAQLISQDGAQVQGEEGIEEKTAEEIEAEERARKEQEEREEILSRMEEEQRQQDEADQR